MRAPHLADVIATRPPVGWFEVHAENFMCGGGTLRQLQAIRGDYPVGVHGVGLSLGSADGLQPWHLDRLAELVERIDPVFVSEHLSWCRAGGSFLNGLLPLPYTEESLRVVARNLERVQERLRRPILLENPSAYLRFAHSTIPEPTFLDALVRGTGCGLLCDVNNVHVTCSNLGGDPLAWLDALPATAVRELHLAGHAANEIDTATVLIDDHGRPVCEAVWALYEHAVRRFRSAATLIEWDTNIPALATLSAEAAKADRRRTVAIEEHSHVAIA